MSCRATAGSGSWGDTRQRAARKGRAQEGEAQEHRDTGGVNAQRRITWEGGKTMARARPGCAGCCAGAGASAAGQAACAPTAPPRTTLWQNATTLRGAFRGQGARGPQAAFAWGKAKAKRGTAPRIDSGPWGRPCWRWRHPSNRLRADGRTRRAAPLPQVPLRQPGRSQAKQSVG